MKQIKRHVPVRTYDSKGLPTTKPVVVTIVGEYQTLSDGVIELSFGASRCSSKDNFIKSTGMKQATERFEKSPYVERFPVKEYGISFVISLLSEHIAHNAEYIRIHFKS